MQSSQVKGVLSVVGTAAVYFAMGLYFSSGNTAVYITSYLRFHVESDAQLSDSIWFLAAVGLSALILPFGGWLDSIIGVRAVCLLGGILQSVGIISTYFAMDTTFPLVVICYGGGFLLSFGVCYTPLLANINKWFPRRKGLCTGIVAAAMAAAPTLWAPLITAYVNPNNVAPDVDGYFIDLEVLERTRQSMLLQGSVTLVLFLVGVSMIFQSPYIFKSDRQAYQPDPMANNKKQPLSIQFSDGMEEGLTPKQAIRTREFLLLAIKIMLTELVFFYLLFVYKPFGQTFIMNDFFLSAVGACAAVCNTVCRLVVGHIKDLTTYKKCCIPLSGLATILVVTLPFTSYAPKIVYAFWVVSAVGIVGSQYALMPSAVTEAFGEKYASINIGLVYMSTVIADIAGAFASQLLTDSLGWSGMIGMIGACSLIDFIITFWLPNDQKLRLRQRMGMDNEAFNNGQRVDDVETCKPTPPPVTYPSHPVVTRRTSIPKPNSMAKSNDFTREATRL